MTRRFVVGTGSDGSFEQSPALPVPTRIKCDGNLILFEAANKQCSESSKIAVSCCNI